MEQRCLAEKYRSDREKLLKHIISSSPNLISSSSTPLHLINFDIISVDYVLRCIQSGCVLDISEATTTYYHELSNPTSIDSETGTVCITNNTDAKSSTVGIQKKKKAAPQRPVGLVKQTLDRKTALPKNEISLKAGNETVIPSKSIPLQTAPPEIDEYDLVDPVDILTPLEKSGFWEGVKATKWSERKKAVGELTKLASTKKIAPGDFTEVCLTLKKLITDVNIFVSVEAIRAIGNLARGLRAHFAGSSCFLLPVLLEKLKEKKPTLIDALIETLQAMYKSGCLLIFLKMSRPL